MKQAGRGSLFSVTLSIAPILLRGTPDCRSHEIGSQGILLFGVRTFLPDYASGRLLEPACLQQVDLLQAGFPADRLSCFCFTRTYFYSTLFKLVI